MSGGKEEQEDQQQEDGMQRQPTLQDDYADEANRVNRVASSGKTDDYASISDRKKSEVNNNVITDHDVRKKLESDLISTDTIRGSLEENKEKDEAVKSPTNSDHHVAFPERDDRRSSNNKQVTRNHQSNAGLTDRVAPIAAARTRLSSAGAQSRKPSHISGQQQDFDARNNNDLIRKSLIPAADGNNNNSSGFPDHRRSHSSKWSMKSNGRKWMTSIKLSLWFTSVFTFIFCFFYFFLHVLLLVKVWDPVHSEPPVRDAADQVDKFIQSLDSKIKSEDTIEGTSGIKGVIPGTATIGEPELIDDHRHSREKSIMSLILILVLSFHSIIFYIFSSTLSKSIRKIDSYHREILFHQENHAYASIDPPVYSIEPDLHRQHSHTHSHHHHGHHHRHSSTAGLTHASTTNTGSSSGGQFPRHYRETSTWKLQHSMPEDVHHEQYYYRKSRARSRLDEEMGISRKDRHVLMYSFFGVLAALLCLLIHVMIQFCFCLALYQPYMDLMDCLLLIFSSFIIIFSLTFIFIASYYHRKKIYA